eukprot:GHVR01129903.1.p1 GENE.GHVR01129903.1~~GHVR01129903.1.p1  ORF type:complete len:100 (+),score=3.65 GHVR01129903.1:233-532(+)
MIITWMSFGYHLDIIWISYGYHMIVIWISFGCHLDVIWMSFGCHLDVIWMSFGCHLVIICIDGGGLIFFPLDFLLISSFSLNLSTCAPLAHIIHLTCAK